MGSGASSSADRFKAGVASAQSDAVLFATRIKEAGKSSEGLAIVSKLRDNKLSGEAKSLFENLLDQLQSALS